MFKCNIIQFNCNGLISHYSKIKILIANHDPDFVLLQELKIPNNKIITFKGYTLVFKNNPESYLKGSTGILIKDGIPFQKIDLGNDVMALGIDTFLSVPISIISYYDNQRTKLLSNNNLAKLVRKMKYPTIVMGDFNAHHQL